MRDSASMRFLHSMIVLHQVATAIASHVIRSCNYLD